ncbi:MAG: oxygen-independent coproporphyrinogen III oxidase [Rhodospirillaceae bacterium]|jgi:oxygen-independent coproporphyrinogen III oxidase|nr:oxygen-independent coproporphyrinogen III oxidase [Rhodospirillaceae bacterium]
MDSELVARWDRSVPRYTSYPTAPHFKPSVGAETYARWLAELDSGLPLSLYVHVPFCRELCWFCGCQTGVARKDGPLDAYGARLIEEIAAVAERLSGRFRVRHVHFGGGTPTIGGGRLVGAAMAAFRARFDLEDGAEIACEIDPRTCTTQTVEALTAAGINRASLGVQDINPEVQRLINRIQPTDQTAAVVAALRGEGIGAINLDLMYGLPAQTVARVERTVEAAHGLAPDRLALFGYAHVPWMKKHQRLIDEALLPDGPERWRQWGAASARLAALGYTAIGFDHFARPEDPLARALAEGRLRRNFQGYTADPAPVLLGFGASAIGALPQGYVQNAAETTAWNQALRAHGLATVRGVALDGDDRLRRAVIERLMCDMAVDVASVAREHRVAPEALDDAFDELRAMAGDGLLALDDRRVAMTETGRPFVRLAAAAFDAHLHKGAARHSRAV